MTDKWTYGKSKKYDTYTPYRYPINRVPPENRSFLSGFKQVIEIPALISKSFAQYDKENSEIIKMGIKRYGWFNSFTVLNQSDQIVEISLDYSNNKKYVIPAGVQTSISDVLFESFNIKNIGNGNIASDGLVKVYVIYERPIIREGV